MMYLFEHLGKQMPNPHYNSLQIGNDTENALPTKAVMTAHIHFYLLMSAVMIVLVGTF